VKGKIRKVLLIRLSSLGDLVIMSSLIEFLFHKGVRIHIALYERFSDLFEGDPRVEKLIKIKRDFNGKWRGLEDVRKVKYDLVVDLHRKLYPSVIALASRTKYRAYVRKNSIVRRFAVLYKRGIKEDPIYVRYVKAVSKYFEIDRIPYPKLVSFKEPEFSLPYNYTVIVPGASKHTKRWPIDYYIDLGKRINTSYNLPVVVVGNERLADSYPEGFINLARSTTLRELLYILKNAHFVVSNDTGPAHMAAAVGTPLFVIFGPTIPEFGFRPAGEGFIRTLEKDLPCRPCTLHGGDKCPLGHFRCMLEIKPEEVFNEIGKFYSREINQNF